MQRTTSEDSFAVRSIMDTNSAARMACADSASQLNWLDLLNRSSHARWSALHGALALAVAAVLAVLALCAPAAYADDIDYVYDESGRLVQASNRTSGEAVRYTYDAVGNITSQISEPITTLAVGHFSPRRGPVGTQVTINGTGFNPAPASNIVRFNGTQATVVSATQTHLVTIVPASAASGPISVEVGAASATSREPFGVTAAGEGPSIAVVLPNLSLPGNTITIVGANFEPLPTQNRVVFNNALADVLASTETTITVRVPAEAGPGKIKVTTPRGVAISPTDFIVLPPGYGVPQLTSIDRVGTDGTGSIVSVTASNTYGARLFEGKAGDLLAVGVSGMSVASAEVRVYTPENIMIASATLTAAAPGLQVPKLPVTGTYTIYVFPSAVGSVTVGVFKPTTASLVLGTPMPVNITLPGRRARLTFTVPANTHADVTLSSVALAAGTFSLIAPNGAVLKSQTFNTTGMTWRPLLAQAGTYALVIDPTGSIAGSVTASVTTSTAASLSANSPQELTISSATPINLTFRGQPGEYKSITTVLNAPAPFSMTISLLNPDGSPLASRAVGTSYTGGGRSGGSGVFNFGPLTQGGTFAVTLQRTGGSSSTVTLTLTDALAGAALIANGSTVVAAVSSEGQSVVRSFAGGAGEFLSLAVVEQAGGMRGATARILKPDGTELTSREFTIPLGNGGVIGGADDRFRHGSAVVNMGPLPMSGAYRVLVQQSDIGRKEDIYTGEWRLTLTRPIEGTVIVDGGTDIREISTTGQGVLYRFSGAVGEYLSFGMSSSIASFDAMVTSVLDPEGAEIAAGSMTIGQTSSGGLIVRYGSGVVNIGPLKVSGTYTIFVQQLGYRIEGVGEVNATLSHPAGGNLPLNATTQVPVSRPGQSVLSAFSGSVGQYRTISLESAGWITASRMKILAPDGAELPNAVVNIATTAQTAAGTIQGYIGHDFLNIGPLATSGTYRVLVQQTGSGRPNTGTFSLGLSGPVTGTLSANGSPTTVAMRMASQGLYYTFPAAAGDYRSLVVSESLGSIRSATVSIIAPGGEVLSSGALNASGSPGPNGTTLYSGRMLLNAGPMPATGNYAVLVRQAGNEFNNANQALTLTLSQPLQGAMSASGADTISVSTIGQSMLRTFAATAGQQVSVQVSETNSGIANASIRIITPDGLQQLSAATMNATGCSGCSNFNGNATLVSGPLPTSGNYGVLIQQTSLSGTGTGTLTVTVAGQSLGAGGTSNIATTTPGQVATSGFTAVAGQSFSVALSSVVMAPSASANYTVVVLRPNGLVQISASCSGENSGCEIPLRDLPLTGTYQIEIRPVSTATIAGVLTISPALAGSMTPNVPAVLSPSSMGQTSLFGFTTTSKQTWALHLESLSTDPANTSVLMHVSDLSKVGYGSIETRTGGVLNLVDLPTGTYVVWIVPQYPVTSTMQLTLRSKPAPMVPGNGTVNFTTTAPGENSYFTFNATAGENLAVALTNTFVTPLPASNATTHIMHVLQPDRRPLGSVNCLSTASGSPGCEYPIRHAPQSGTYTVQIVPLSVSTKISGTITVSAALAGALTPNAPFVANLNTLGQVAELTFNSTGARYFLDVGVVSTTPSATVNVVVYDAAGAVVESGWVTLGMSLNLPNLKLGTHYVWIKPDVPMAGSLQLTLRTTPKVLTDGAATSFSVATPGQSTFYSFYGEAGQSAAVALSSVLVTPLPTGSNVLTHRIYVIKPDNWSMPYVNCSSSPSGSPGCVYPIRILPQSGVYTVQIVPVAANTTVSGLLTVSIEPTRALVPNVSSTVSVDTIGEVAHLSFTATAGQYFSLNVGGVNTTPSTVVYVDVYDSAGAKVANGWTASGMSLNLPNLKADTYFVWITPDVPMTGSVQLTLRTTPQVPTNGTATNFSVATPGQHAQFNFYGEAGQSAAVALSNVLVTPLPTSSNVTTYRIYLIRPDSASMSFVNCTSSPSGSPRCEYPIPFLPQTGMYTVQIIPFAATTALNGLLTVSIAPTGALMPDASSTGGADIIGWTAHLNVTATAKQNRSLDVAGLGETPVTASY